MLTILLIVTVIRVNNAETKYILLLTFDEIHVKKHKQYFETINNERLWLQHY